MIILVSKEKYMSERVEESNSPKLAQLPIKDLAILNFTTESDVKRFYTGELEWIPYSVVELMLDTRVQNRNMGIHKISSYEDSLYVLYKYSTKIFIADNPGLLHIIVAADILNLTEEHIIEMAKEEDKLYSDQDGDCFIDSQWLIDTYNSIIRDLGIESDVKLANKGKGQVELIIKRKL